MRATSFAGDAGVEFVRRVITRPMRSASEDHDTLADAAFEEAENAGAFAISWSAHGLRYGLPAQPRRDDRHRVMSRSPTSRAARSPLLSARYANVIVVEITASADILAQRLAARGRESRGEVLARLARSAELGGSVPGAVAIDNSGSREEAGERFVAILRKAIAVSDVAGTV